MENDQLEVRDNLVVMPPFHRDAVTGAVFVHKDYTERIHAFEAQGHVAPVRTTIAFKGVGSWAAYINRYGVEDKALLTHDAVGLTATLDYHQDSYDGEPGMPGRCQWIAKYDYPFSEIYRAWHAAFGAGELSQEDMVNLLADSAPFVQATAEMDAAKMLSIVQTLRVTTNSAAQTELRADGTTAIEYSQDTQVRGNKGGTAEIPREVVVSIPIIDDTVITFAVRIRLRPTKDNRVNFVVASWDFDDETDKALAAIVDKAKEALGDFGVPILHQA